MHSPAHLPCGDSLCSQGGRYVFAFTNATGSKTGRFDKNTPKRYKRPNKTRTLSAKNDQLNGCGVLQGYFHSFHKVIHRKKVEKSGFSRFIPTDGGKKHVESKVFHRPCENGANFLPTHQKRPKFDLAQEKLTVYSAYAGKGDSERTAMGWLESCAWLRRWH